MEYDDDNVYDYDDAYESEEEVYDMQVNIAASDGNDNDSCLKKYTVLSLKDISEREHNAIATVCNVLSVSEVEAAILLRHFYWDISNVYDQWFANEEKVRNGVGLFLHEPNVKEEENSIRCPICFDDYKMGDMKGLKYCGHRFCEECWRLYIHTSINNDGVGCLNLRCPNINPRCGAVVGQDMVFSLGLSEEDASKYTTYLVRSYVEQNRRVKWCPAPRCEYAVQIDVVTVNASREVVCNCSYKFCWNCLEECHCPVDCDTVKKWVSMINEGESQNLYWIIGNSKPCPKCKRAIEKNSGCMRMTCLQPCGFEFCWICLRHWNVHGYDTSVACNQYRPPEVGEDNSSHGSIPEDVMKLTAKMSSDRFVFYLERWKANEKSQEKAFSDLQRVRVVELKELVDSLVLSKSQSRMRGFKCVVDAWLQIVECRRMLKWTYAYGYYLPLQLRKQKQNFFEFLQGEAENSLERLHQCAEHELQQQMEGVRNAEAHIETSDIHSTSRDFDYFYKKLEGLTKSTTAHFEKLIQAFENGLSEVQY